MQFNGQRAEIAVPPLMRFASNGAANLNTEMTVIEADVGKSIIVHAIRLTAANTALTDAGWIAIRFVDAWTGVTCYLPLYLTPSSVNSTNMEISGLNMPIMAGTKVQLLPENGKTVSSGNAYIWYSLIDAY